MLLRLLGCAFIVALTMLILGCATNQKTGTLIGAATGAVVGAAIEDDAAVIVAGALIGGFIGNRIGARMDRRDQARVGEALEHSASHETTEWINPDSGNTYRLTPTTNYRSDSNPCRDFTLTAVIDGDEDSMQGIACRRPNGVWATS